MRFAAAAVLALSLAAPALSLSVPSAQAHNGEFRAVPISETAEDKTILGVLTSDPQFSIIGHVVSTDEDYKKVLEGKGPLTFFAPNDDAIRRMHPPPHHGGPPHRGHPPAEGQPDNGDDSSEPGKPGPHHPPIPPHEVIHKVLQYHTVESSKKAGDLDRGVLLDSALKLDSLKGANQKIRICAWKDKDEEKHVLVNCYIPVRRADISASNGVVHEIGGVMIPPGPVTRQLGRLPRMFGLFVFTVRRAELSGTMDNTPGLTVFAPPNRAFLKLGWKTLRYLLSPMGFKSLRRILTYHASNTLAYSGPVFEAGHASLTTIEGGTLELKVGKAEWHGKEREVLKINGDKSTVWFPDAPVANGVVHVISEVLAPAKLLEEIAAEAERVFPGRFEVNEIDDLEVRSVFMEAMEAAEQRTCPKKMWKGLDNLDWEL